MDAIILLEYIWSSSYSPWSTLSAPWQTSAPNGKLNLSSQTTTVIQGIGASINTATQTIALTLPAQTIVQGQGATIGAVTENITLTAPIATIKTSWTEFAGVCYLSLVVVNPNKVGTLWDIRIKPTDIWIDRTKTSGEWSERKQLLWAYNIFPWEASYYPWLTSNISTGYGDRVKPTTSFSNRIKPTTTWQQLQH
jgi:hypothetical protein